jgi:hypothetical protein
MTISSTTSGAHPVLPFSPPFFKERGRMNRATLIIGWTIDKETDPWVKAIDEPNAEKSGEVLPATAAQKSRKK